MNPKEKNSSWKYAIPIIILTVIMFIVYIPRVMQQGRAQTFAEPLATHATPEGVEVVQIGTGEEGDSVIAALLLKTERSPEELIELYSDIEYPPYKEGETVEMQTKEVDEGTISAMQQAGVYEEGASYIFLYIRSK